MTDATRYAVYWVPSRTHPLWEAGCEWLGRDPESSATSPPDTRNADHRSEPRRYGFHATLKAPMRLVDGSGEERLMDAVEAVARTTPSVALPELRVHRLAGFVALRPSTPGGSREPLRSLADRCVMELDRLRAPFTDEEWSARTSGLDANARSLTRTWGYHHVLDAWRFHMTLSNAFASVGDDERDEKARLAAAAERHFAAALSIPLRGGEIAVFVERAPGDALRLVRRFPLAPA